jgi:hypothetical protein
MKSIYIIGSLRNPEIPLLGNDLRKLGLDVFDDWFSSGPETDDYWQKYEKIRGRTYGEALEGTMAEHIFSYDKHHLDRTDGVVMLAPAGKSGHMELGYTIGKGKPGFVLFDKEPERYDVMYRFATGIFFDRQKFFDHLIENYLKPRTRGPNPAGFLRCIHCLRIGGHTDWCPHR